MSNTADRYAYNPYQRTALLVTLALSLLVRMRPAKSSRL